MATYSSILVWSIPVDTRVWQATVHGVAESDITEQLSTAQNQFNHHFKIEPQRVAENYDGELL